MLDGRMFPHPLFSSHALILLPDVTIRKSESSSFVLEYDGVVIFIHKQTQCVFLLWLLSRHWLQGTLGNHSSPARMRRRYHGGEQESRQAMHDNKGSNCIYPAGYHLQLHSVVSHRLALVPNSIHSGLK